MPCKLNEKRMASVVSTQLASVPEGAFYVWNECTRIGHQTPLSVLIKIIIAHLKILQGKELCLENGKYRAHTEEVCVCVCV